jgi:hypothetical protein
MRTDKKLYLFPSLAKQGIISSSPFYSFFTFIMNKNYDGVVQTGLIKFKGSGDLEIKFQGGLQFKAPNRMVFVTGLFCQLIVNYLKELNVSSFFYFYFFNIYIFFFDSVQGVARRWQEDISEWGCSSMSWDVPW